MKMREGKFLIRMVVAAVLIVVFVALAVVIWLPVLRPPVSGWAEAEGFRPRAEVPPRHWFFLKDGSVIAGLLKSLNREYAVVATSWGGEVKIPRSALAGFTNSPLLVPRPDKNNSDGNIQETLLSSSPSRETGGALFRLYDGGIIAGEPIRGLPPDMVAFRSSSLGYVEIPAVWVMKDAAGNMLQEKYSAAARPGQPVCLCNGNNLVCDHAKDRVIEVTREGEVIWSHRAAGPVAARRLPTGRTLIAENHKSRLIEVGPGGIDVWEGLRNITDCLRLPDGNTLVVTGERGGALVKIDYKGERLWRVNNIPHSAFIVRATGQFIEIANPDLSCCVYINQMGGIIFETFRRFEYDE